MALFDDAMSYNKIALSRHGGYWELLVIMYAEVSEHCYGRHNVSRKSVKPLVVY